MWGEPEKHKFMVCVGIFLTIIVLYALWEWEEGVLNFLWLAEKFFLKFFFLSLFYSLAEYAIA